MPEPVAAPVRKRAFAPVVDAGTRLLILGSLPGERSLAEHRYYANPLNGFWRLLAAAIGVDLPALAYPERLAALLANGVGLWDVVREAERKGSLDGAIRDVAANDLAGLTASLPALSAIAFNGGTAARIGTKQLGPAAARYRLLTLLSSSGACAVKAGVKQADWLRLRECLA